MESRRQQIFNKLQVLIAKNTRKMSNRSDHCENVVEVPGRGTLLETTSSNKRKAEEELLETTSSKKRKTQGEMAEASRNQKRKAEEEEEEGERPRKRCCLDSISSENIKPATFLQRSSQRQSKEYAQCTDDPTQSPSLSAFPTDSDLQGVFTPPPTPTPINPPVAAPAAPVQAAGTSAVSPTPRPARAAHKKRLSCNSKEPEVPRIDQRVHVRKNYCHFKKTYCQTKVLGEGGFGAVFAGIRRFDSLPVAIKHIPIGDVMYTSVKYKGRVYQEISEVVLMAQAAGLLCNGSEANPAVIKLLDVYKLKKEVLIVMEQPLNVSDFVDFHDLREGNIPEQEAKALFKQLVDASLIMHNNKVFHRDIKGENILVSLNHQIPSIKIIDFGCGEFVQDEPYTKFSGTSAYAPPEFFLDGCYEAEPTTVWQIGALLRHFYGEEEFHTIDFLNGPVHYYYHLSQECNDFMSKCLTLNPCKRPCLEELQRHPWLVC